ncbi:MAG: hypothetical protein WC583_02775 [Candidatus Omnitrophota bacterium]|jgi:hypothetical protein|nr:glycosyltransferase [Sphaerochaeta sp.]
MNSKLVFWTAFNCYQSSKLLRGKPRGTVHPVTTAAWTRRRVELFTRYNLPSILSQTHEDFLYLVLCDPQLRHLTDPYFTKPFDPRVVFVYEDGPGLALIHQYDEIVQALIDSDDMYSREAGALMMACPEPWMYFRRGYALEERRGRLWEYDTIGSGPFWARKINPKEIRSFDREKRHPTHKAVIDFRPRELPAGRFCVLLHDVNTSSTPHMRYVLPKAADPKILSREFGLRPRGKK